MRFSTTWEGFWAGKGKDLGLNGRRPGWEVKRSVAAYDDLRTGYEGEKEEKVVFFNVLGPIPTATSLKCPVARNKWGEAPFVHWGILGKDVNIFSNLIPWSVDLCPMDPKGRNLLRGFSVVTNFIIIRTQPP